MPSRVLLGNTLLPFRLFDADEFVSFRLIVADELVPFRLFSSGVGMNLWFRPVSSLVRDVLVSFADWNLCRFASTNSGIFASLYWGL